MEGRSAHISAVLSHTAPNQYYPILRYLLCGKLRMADLLEITMSMEFDKNVIKIK